MTNKYISVTELDDSGGSCVVSQSLQPLPGGITPNLLINGGFDIWQRGTSFTATGYTADRWRADEGTGAFTVTQQSFALGQTDVPGEPEFFLECDMTSGSTTAPTLEQRVEGVRTLGGQSATLSFYAKVASGTLSVTPRMRQSFGTGGSPSADVDTNGSNITITSSWQLFEVTINVPSISGKTLGTAGNDYLSAMFVLPTSSTFTLSVAQAKLETGVVATSFVPRLYGEELSLCQRYAYTSTLDVSPGGFGTFAFQGSAFSTTNFRCLTAHPVVMLSTPVMSLIAGTITDLRVQGWGGNFDITAFGMYDSTSQSSHIYFTAAGMTAGYGAQVAHDGLGSDVVFLFDAEL